MKASCGLTKETLHIPAPVEAQLDVVAVCQLGSVLGVCFLHELQLLPLLAPDVEEGENGEGGHKDGQAELATGPANAHLS